MMSVPYHCLRDGDESDRLSELMIIIINHRLLIIIDYRMRIGTRQIRLFQY